MLIKISIGILVVLFLYCVYCYFLSRRLKNENSMLRTTPPFPTIFDSAAPQLGMKPIHDFLRSEYLKYINSILIQYNEKSELPITQFLSEIANDTAMSKMAIGFELTVEANMGKQLKSYFCKYYNVLDDNRQTNDNFSNYVTQWFLLNIRSIQARMSMSKQNVTDYSIDTEKILNSNVFIDIEMELYKNQGLLDNDIMNDSNKQHKK